MAKIRVSEAARADLEHILATSEERWGDAGRARYAALLASAIRRIARDPEDPSTRDRPELSPGVRSFHVRHARGRSAVRDPAHVIFFRARKSVIEIVRVLHERMEPVLQVGKRR